MKLNYLLLLFFIFSFFGLKAQTKTWNGSISNNWYEAGNWSLSNGATAGSPTASDNVIINNVASNVPLIGTGNAFARTLSISSAVLNTMLNINSGATLTVSSNSSAAISLNKAILVNNGSLVAINSNSNVSLQAAVNIFGDGSFENYGNAEIEGGANIGLIVSAGSFKNFTGSSLISNGLEILRLNNLSALFHNFDGASFTGLGSTRAIFMQPGAFVNAGIVDITGGVEFYSSATFGNNACGKIKITGDFFNQTTSGANNFSNDGFLQVTGILSNNRSAVNTGVLKFGSIDGGVAITNNSNSSVIVNDSPSAIFTYGGTFNGTINGIFKDNLATISAGAFTFPNTFVADPSLPLGSQTLFAKITPLSGLCSFIVPFTYVYTLPPVFTTQPSNALACSGTAISFSIVATDAVSYQWQLSTNNGSTWSNVTNGGIYTNVTLPTLNISNNATLANTIFRCVATGSGGSTNSNSASVVLNPTSTPPVSGTITWTGAVSTDWNSPCNWSPASVPTAANEVIINNVANDPIVNVGTTASTGYLILNSGSILVVNAGATLNVRGNGNDGMRLTLSTFTNNGVTDIQQEGGLPFVSGGIFSTNGSTINNGGILTVNANSSPISNNGGTFAVNNNANGILNVINGNAFTSIGTSTIRINIVNNGIINSNCNSWSGFHTLTNNGIVNITRGGISILSGKTITNNLCGKIYVHDGNFIHNGSATNNGYIFIKNTLNGSTTFNNRGILKYGLKDGTGNLSNTTTAAIIVNDTPSPIFTYGSSPYNGVIDGIFIDSLEVTSAGTFTLPNTFVPSQTLPLSIQKLFAKITPEGSGCTYIVPFQFANIPTISSQPINTTACSPNGVQISVEVIRAISFEWELSTDGGSTYNPLSNSGIYSGVGTNTLMISSSINLNNFRYRCIISNPAGSVTSNAANLTVLNAVNSPTGTLTWTGAINTDWSLACNWNPTSVPGPENDVVIPNTVIKPQINAGLNAFAKTVDLTLSGSQLTLLPTATLTINGSKSISSVLIALNISNGVINNSGTIIIGNSSASGATALQNRGTYNNLTGSELRIDNTTREAIRNSTSGVVSNSGLILLGQLSSIGSTGIHNSSNFSNNLGGEIVIDRAESGIFSNGGFSNNGEIVIAQNSQFSQNGITNDATFTNGTTGQIIFHQIQQACIFSRSNTFNNEGTITVKNTASGSSIFLNDATFNNLSTGQILVETNANASTGIFVRGGNYNNHGLITLNSGSVLNRATINNFACGKLMVMNAGITNDITRSILNEGYMFFSGTINNNGTFQNNGVLKYGGLSGSSVIISNSNGSLIVNDNPSNSSIFTFGGSFNGVINGIFTNSIATISGGVFTMPNTFIPSASLPLGSQTLYARITPLGGLCSFIVPFLYTYQIPAPSIIQQPQNVFTCPAGTAIFSVQVLNAVSFQWQISTNGGTTYSNISNGGVYSGANLPILQIANVSGLTGQMFRCIATGSGGSSPSMAAVININAASIVLISPTNNISTNIGVIQANSAITASNDIISPGRAIFRAGNGINLEPGFQVNAGSVFTAQIGACN